MKISVDRGLCAGHALCRMKAPKLYRLDDEGFCISDGVIVPGDMVEDAKLGAQACPENAITLTDEVA